MISTEDEDDMPYDMYTNEIEDRISPEAPNDKTSSVEKEEVKKITPEENIVKDIDNTITNLVRKPVFETNTVEWSLFIASSSLS